jgi:cold shock CspA family protein
MTTQSDAKTMSPAQHLTVLASRDLNIHFRIKNKKGGFDSPTPGGCLGRLAPGEVVEMLALTPVSAKPAFFASMKRDHEGVDSLHLLAQQDINDTTNQVVWSHHFKMASCTERGVGVPIWPHNRLYFLIEGESPGQYFLYLLGVTAQDYQTFVWLKPACQAKITRTSNGQLSIGNFAKSVLWEKFILGIIGNPGDIRYEELEVDDTPPAVLPGFNPEELKPGHGRVRFFNVFDGTGIVQFKDVGGDVVEAKVHYSSLPRVERGEIRLLEEGDIVTGTLELGTHQKGPQKGKDYFELKRVRVV